MIRTKEDIIRDYELSVFRQLKRLVSSQTTNVGSFISTDGINLIWSGGGSSLPSQSGNAGKFLTTDGTNTSWGSIPGVSTIVGITGTKAQYNTSLTDGDFYFVGDTLPTQVAGSNTQIQFNNSGAFGASSNLTWNGTVLSSLTIKSSASAGNGFGIGDGYWFIDREGAAGNTGAMRFQGKVFSVHGDVTAFKFVDQSNTVLTSINTTGQLNITPLALASAQATSALNIAQTWNTSGTPTAIKLRVTDTASNAASLLMDLGTTAIGSIFTVPKSTTGVAFLQSNLNLIGYLSNSFSGIVQLGGSGTATDNMYVNLIQSSVGIGIASATSTSARLDVLGKSLTGSADNSILNLSQTWNTTGNPTALKVNVTNTASGASAKLVDFQISSISKFSIDKDALPWEFKSYGLLSGGAIIRTDASNIGFYYASQANGWFNLTSSGFEIDYAGVSKTDTSGTVNLLKTNATTFAPTSGTGVFNLFNLSSVINQTGGANGITRGIYINPTLTAAADYRAFESTQGRVRIADTTVAGSGSLARSLLDLTQTWSTSGTPTAIKLNVTNTASAFASYLMDLQVGGVSQFAFRKDGYAILGGVTIGPNGVYIATSSWLEFTGRSQITSPSDGIIKFTNNAQTDFSRLQFGGTTSSFPAIKRNGTELQARLADDSNFAAVQSLYQRFGSGSPESVVTAPVGAIYHRTDGGAGTSFYVKESGVSNTGWVSK